MKANVRHYSAAGFNFKVTSDYPISDNTFDYKFRLFECVEFESTDINIYHHFKDFEFGFLEKSSRIFSFECLDVYVDSEKILLCPKEV